MGELRLNTIIKENSLLQFYYTVSKDIKKYFRDTPFKIEYPESVESVPDSIAAIPFVCNVLPIIWMTDTVLQIPELDKTFYGSIPKIKAGYEIMYPEAEFKGSIKVEKIVDNHYGNTGKSAMFFSGGLDSAQTFISHLEEKPVLLAIWGSDIKYDNEEGWKLVEDVIAQTAEKFKVQKAIIHSTFREFDDEALLNCLFSPLLQDDWWHGIKHSLALLGHVAPYAWCHKINTMYIAASFCKADGKVRCASDPTIDNQVRFSDCQVVHDGYEYSRQDKIHNLSEFCKERKEYFPLHVCWQSQEGNNCCECEKCYRTMAGLWAEGENPEDYSFFKAKEALARMRFYVVSNSIKYSYAIRYQWPYIQNRALENERLLRKKNYYNKFKWVLTADFMHPENLKLPIQYRIRAKMSHFKVYRCLHKIKMILLKRDKL